MLIHAQAHAAQMQCVTLITIAQFVHALVDSLAILSSDVMTFLVRYSKYFDFKFCELLKSCIFDSAER